MFIPRNLEEANVEIKRLQRIRSSMRRQYKKLKESTGPRYVVWYWLHGSKSVALDIHGEYDCRSTALREVKTAAAQPCNSYNTENVFIHVRGEEA